MTSPDEALVERALHLAKNVVADQQTSGDFNTPDERILFDDRKLLAQALLAACAPAWRPTSEALRDGTPIRGSNTMRFAPWEDGTPGGRWQERDTNGYWHTCNEPTEWQPFPSPPPGEKL